MKVTVELPLDLLQRVAEFVIVTRRLKTEDSGPLYRLALLVLKTANESLQAKTDE